MAMKAIEGGGGGAQDTTTPSFTPTQGKDGNTYYTQESLDSANQAFDAKTSNVGTDTAINDIITGKATTGGQTTTNATEGTVTNNSSTGSSNTGGVSSDTSVAASNAEPEWIDNPAFDWFNPSTWHKVKNPKWTGGTAETPAATTPSTAQPSPTSAPDPVAPAEPPPPPPPAPKFKDKNGNEFSSQADADASTARILADEAVKAQTDRANAIIGSESLGTGALGGIKSATDYLNTLMINPATGKAYTPVEQLALWGNAASPYAQGAAQDAAAIAAQSARSQGLNAGQAGLAGGQIVGDVYTKNINEGIDRLNTMNATDIQSGLGVLNSSLNELGIGANLLSSATGQAVSLADLSQSGKQFFAQLDQNAEQFLLTLQQTKDKLGADAWSKFWGTLAGMIPFVGPTLKAGIEALAPKENK